MPYYSNYLTNAIRYLDTIGVTDVIIPFLLIFTVVYVALQKAKVFGSDEDKTKRYSIVVALALALGVIISHVTRNFTFSRGIDAVAIINSAIPKVSLVVIAILFFLIMIGVFGYQPEEGKSNFGGLVSILAILTVAYIFLTSAGFFPYGPGTYLYSLGPDTTALIVVILIFGAIVYFITAPKKEKNTGEGLSNFLKSFNKKI